jgi:hypothetical protein
MNRKNKTNQEREDAEYGVDSRYSSKKERQADGKALMEGRLQRMQNVTEDQIIKAKLLQLKLNMEEYIKKPEYKDHNYFTEFLTIYIDTIYRRRHDFAHDISITPVRLSQVLNNHREPKDEFMLRLMIHSEKTYQNVCHFNKLIWHQVYFHEKICEMMSSQDEWRPNVEKHVKFHKAIKAKIKL